MAFPTLGLAKIVWAVDVILALDLPEFRPGPGIIHESTGRAPVASPSRPTGRRPQAAAVSKSLDYLGAVRGDALGHYFAFRQDCGKHLDPKTRAIISVLLQVDAQPARGLRP